MNCRTDTIGFPKLMRRSRLGYDLTLFCVLLRDELRRYEEQNSDADRCVVDTDDLFTRLNEVMPDSEDEVRLRKKFDQLMTRAQELGFLRKLPSEPPVYEIRPILKARITAERMEELKQQLGAYASAEKPAEENDG